MYGSPLKPPDPNDPFGKKSWPKPGSAGRVGPKPGSSGGSPQPEPEAPAPVAQEKPKEKPKATLSNPKWAKDKGLFNEKVKISVDGTLPDEIKSITKVEFQIFAVLPDGKKEAVGKVEGHLKEGKAEAEAALQPPQAKGPEGKPLEKCKYLFKAKHRDSEEVESPTLEAQQFAINVRFEKEEGWVGETVKVLADTVLPDDQEVSVKIAISHRVSAEGKVKAKAGKLEYAYTPCLCGIEAKDNKLPAYAQAQAEFIHGKEKAQSAKIFKLKPVMSLDWESFAKDYSWNGFTVHSAFRQKFDGLKCKIEVKEEVLKAWGGYWINMSAAGITGKAGGCPWDGYRWGRVHGSGMVPNRYHDGTAWKTFPAGFTPGDGDYSAVGFVKSGTKYKQVNDTGEWPEAFTDYEFSAHNTKRTKWANDTHTRFSGKFKMRPKSCPKAADKDGCGYAVDLTLELKKVDTPTTHSISLVPGYGRSNAAIFFYDETRIAVAAHETGHLVGLPDEYSGGATDTSQPDGDGLVSGIDDDSLMGANLTKVKKRHYVNFLAMAKKMWKAKTGQDLEFIAAKA